MASIKAYKNKENTTISYRFRVCIGRNSNGKQIWATKTVRVTENLTPKKTEKEMQRQADEWERLLIASATPSKKSTFERFVNCTWFPVHVENGQHKPSTIEFYRRMSTRLIDEFGSRDLNAIKAIEIQQFINRLRNDEKQANGNPLSDSTIKHYINLLRIMFGFAEKYDLVERNPMRKIDSPKREQKPVDFLTPEKAKEFICALNDEPLRWRCMMMLLLTCGLRRGEVVALKWKDISFEDRSIHIERAATYTKMQGIVIDKPKSIKSIRKLPLTASLINLISDWKIGQENQYTKETITSDAYVFGLEENPYKTIFPTTPTRWLSKFIKRHNLPNVSPHDLRHTCGSLMLMSGASIKDTQDFLGHEDAKTTLSFYTSSSPESLRKAADSLDSILK